MGFMDKVKAASDQAMATTKQGMAQGQAKINDVQSGRARHELMQSLGEAVYAEQRQGGSHDAVEAALAAIDQHMAAAPAQPAPGAMDAPAPAPLMDATGAPVPPPPAATPPAPTNTPSGDFTL